MSKNHLFYKADVVETSARVVFEHTAFEQFLSWCSKNIGARKVWCADGQWMKTDIGIQNENWLGIHNENGYRDPQWKWI
jgi:hypothetical protein